MTRDIVNTLCFAAAVMAAYCALAVGFAALVGK